MVVSWVENPLRRPPTYKKEAIIDSFDRALEILVIDTILLLSGTEGSTGRSLLRGVYGSVADMKRVRRGSL